MLTIRGIILLIFLIASAGIVSGEPDEPAESPEDMPPLDPSLIKSVKCPECPGLGMQLSSGDSYSYPDYSLLSCSYTRGKAFRPYAAFMLFAFNIPGNAAKKFDDETGYWEKALTTKDFAIKYPDKTLVQNSPGRFVYMTNRILSDGERVFTVSGFLYQSNYVVVINTDSLDKQEALDLFYQMERCAAGVIGAQKSPINRPPTITLTYFPKDPKPGDVVTVVAEAEDKDGDKLTYKWYDRNLKIYLDLPPDQSWSRSKPVIGNALYQLIVKVYDGRGGVAEDYIYFTVDEEVSETSLGVKSGKVTVNENEVVEGDLSKISDKDRIGTSKISSPGNAIIKYTDGSNVMLSPGTSVQVDSDSRSISLEKGDILSNVVDPPFEVTTPSAKGSVKGTMFEVHVGDDGTSIFYIFNGVVGVSDNDLKKTVSVSAGERTICELSGVPSDPESFDLDLHDMWWARSPFGTARGFAAVSGLVFESRSKPVDSSVQIPLTLNGIKENIGNMDIELQYDSSVLDANEVIKGSLAGDSLFDYNIIDGTIKISLADQDGFGGDGSIAYVKFDVIGSEGSSSPLDIVFLSANMAEDMATITIPVRNGIFTVISLGGVVKGTLPVMVVNLQPLMLFMRFRWLLERYRNIRPWM